LQNVCHPRMLLSGIQFFRQLESGFRLKACRNDIFFDFCKRLRFLPV
jgi:hypothetical protein